MPNNAKPGNDDTNIIGLDFDLDFDLSDFDLLDDMADALDAAPQQRILRPRMAKDDDVFHKTLFANAELFADQIDLTPGSRTFAWLSGTFIFGDIVEALVTRRGVGVKNLYVATLSLSQDNIDSLKNVMLLMGDDLEKLILVVSGYQYSHEKYNLVPYMYEELDDGTDRVQIAFGGWHAKIITLETVLGHTLTIHGSANLRSSNSIEQIMVECDNHDLHRFNADIMQHIADRFGTINYKAPWHKLKRIEGNEAFECCKEGAKSEG